MSTNDAGPARRKMTSEGARRIQRSADKNPNGKTATTGFKQRAQSAAERSKGTSKRGK
ncbi:hypothetical protein GCM10010116_40240 [Microbispora rosea subsp. aerata]|nr:hypothetical protein [Microbispora rosea]GGO20073.1 hypothetical protein GCM10010116_40240 [Microbispora rosea subsp. aerata]GIH57069.1 hypothetical protein Mro02_39830 [Microbispora rosea subsp. aerata]GLJ83526.1 hypothetical protein GCM10017588_22540 [Microbispora rosea subsp. aerata]